MANDKTALILKSLGEIIYKLRKEKKMTQEELGKITGTSQMTVKRLESATVGTRVDNLVAIADALGLKLTDLFSKIEGVSAPETQIDDTNWGNIQLKVNELTATERNWVANVVNEILASPWK